VPPSKTGRHTGEPGARASVSWSQMWLDAVGPVNRAPSDPATSLPSDAAASPPRNAASAPKQPRLSPKTISRGRLSAGSWDQRRWTCWYRAVPASAASSRSTRNEIQLGR
jgi:hypothetical protein